MTIPYTKSALIFEQQLDLLADRGLVIPDRPAAAAILSKISGEIPPFHGTAGRMDDPSPVECYFWRGKMNWASAPWVKAW